MCISALREGSGTVKAPANVHAIYLPANAASLVDADNNEAVWNATIENVKLGRTCGPL